MTNSKAIEQINKSARDYEDRWRGYLNHTHRKLLDLLIPDLHEDDVVLDASCGTGLLAHKLLEREAPFSELVLNDLSPRKLAIAQERLPDDPRLSFTSYSAEHLPFEENRFTKVICLNSLHNYEKPSWASRRFKDILMPNGKLYLLDWNRTGLFRFINTVINWSVSETINTMSLEEVTRMLNEHHYRIESTDQWHYWYWRLYLVVAGFQHWKSR